MPEAPELAIVREVLERRLVGAAIVSARVLRPTVVRSLSAEDITQELPGRALLNVSRYGKTLTLGLTGEAAIVVIPMLTGVLRFAAPTTRPAKSVCLALLFSTGDELRYADDRQMGMIYYTPSNRMNEIPRLEETGPDVLDSPLSLPEFAERLRRFRGEMKGILTRGALVAGIGNAYADEIAWAAQLSPFRKRHELWDDEIARLHQSVYEVPRQAVDTLRGLMGEDIHLKPRRWLSVHNKGGQACPRCGGRISEMTANRRITSYCMTCQPGLLIRN